MCKCGFKGLQSCPEYTSVLLYQCQWTKKGDIFCCTRNWNYSDPLTINQFQLSQFFCDLQKLWSCHILSWRNKEMKCSILIKFMATIGWKLLRFTGLTYLLNYIKNEKACFELKNFVKLNRIRLPLVRPQWKTIKDQCGWHFSYLNLVSILLQAMHGTFLVINRST